MANLKKVTLKFEFFRLLRSLKVNGSDLFLEIRTPCNLPSLVKFSDQEFV